MDIQLLNHHHHPDADFGGFVDGDGVFADDDNNDCDNDDYDYDSYVDNFDETLK